jgi:NAD(P)H-quinone oxidoreductase subunit 2
MTPVFGMLGLGAAFATLLLGQYFIEPQILFDGLFRVDKLTVTFGLLITIVGMIVMLMTMGYEHHLGRNRGEFYSILLTAILAVMLLAGSTDLIMLFVGLETLSICCVLLAGFSKGDVKSNEASLKYLLSTAATTATLLYGLSFVYGLTGSTSYAVIADKMSLTALPPDSLMRPFIIVLLLSAVGFKLSAVPFHMWTPDVYEGAPTPVTAFLSIGSKAGGFVIALRLLFMIFGKSSMDWTVIVTGLAIMSMIMGNLIALAQNSFKRMLAYSSIAHVGYILIGLTSCTPQGLGAMMFYIIVYGFMNLGAFAGAILFSNETGSDDINDIGSGAFRLPAQPGRIAYTAGRIFCQALYFCCRHSDAPISGQLFRWLAACWCGFSHFCSCHLLLHARGHKNGGARTVRQGFGAAGNKTVFRQPANLSAHGSWDVRFHHLYHRHCLY